MEVLKKLEEKVRVMLKAKPATRDSDRLLTYCIWHDFYGINSWDPVKDVLLNEKLPSQESIGRIRRKLQEQDETLRGTKARADIRYEAQRDYLDYVNEEVQ